LVTWLSGHGVDRARLAAAGFGDSRPVQDNSAKEAGQKTAASN
jgi:flagellar motor protein MotB